MNKYIILTIIFITIITDYLSKIIAQKLIIGKIDFFAGFLFLENIKNKGVAFSMELPLIKFFTIFLIIGIIFYYIKYEFYRKDKLTDLSFALIIGGSLGNAWERLFLGGVSDFLGVKYFAIFNLADSFLCIGVALLIFQNLLKKTNS